MTKFDPRFHSSIVTNLRQMIKEHNLETTLTDEELYYTWDYWYMCEDVDNAFLDDIKDSPNKFIRG